MIILTIHHFIVGIFLIKNNFYSKNYNFLSEMRWSLFGSKQHWTESHGNHKTGN